jgi:hypothetical protein
MHDGVNLNIKCMCSCSEMIYLNFVLTYYMYIIPAGFILSDNLLVHILLPAPS